MKKYFTKSLWLIIAALLVVSCSKEDGVMDSSSRSDKLEVSFNFFEKSISEIESRAGTADVAQAASPWITRADTDGKKNLSECKQITELEVALFPEGKDTINCMCLEVITRWWLLPLLLITPQKTTRSASNQKLRSSFRKMRSQICFIPIRILS